MHMTWIKSFGPIVGIAMEEQCFGMKYRMEQEAIDWHWWAISSVVLQVWQKNPNKIGREWRGQENHVEDQRFLQFCKL